MGPGGGVGGREKGERLPRAVINSYKANKVISRRPATMGRRDAAAWSVQSTLGKQGEVGRAATLSAQSAPRSNLQPLAFWVFAHCAIVVSSPVTAPGPQFTTDQSFESESFDHTVC